MSEARQRSLQDISVDPTGFDERGSYNPFLRAVNVRHGDRVTIEAVWYDERGSIRKASEVRAAHPRSPKWWIRFKAEALLDLARTEARRDKRRFDLEPVDQIVRDLNAE